MYKHDDDDVVHLKLCAFLLPRSLVTLLPRFLLGLCCRHMWLAVLGGAVHWMISLQSAWANWEGCRTQPIWWLAQAMLCHVHWNKEILNVEAGSQRRKDCFKKTLVFHGYRRQTRLYLMFVMFCPVSTCEHHIYIYIDYSVPLNRSK